MPGKTISEKILSRASHSDARAGDLVICDVDVAMGTDGSVPMALDYFDQMDGRRVFDPARLVFVFDHYAADPMAATFSLQARAREFATRHGAVLYDCGDGVCHQLMVESGRTRPGGLIVGADSHSVTGGALNAFATGIGSSDLAATMISGRIWLRVPETIQITLTGAAAAGVYAKDIALALARRLGADGAAYQALEFDGPGAGLLEIEDRLVLSNMSVEMGAKAGIFRADAKTERYLASRAGEPFTPIEPDADAVYASRIQLDLAELEPCIAMPHQVDRVVAVGQAAGTPVHMVLVGTCTGGRVCDIHQAARILVAAGRIAPGVHVVIAPASREVETRLRADGTLDRIGAMGATIIPPGCGPCCGTAPPIPARGANVISTANRNFKARMGNATASIYLASPATAAASAVRGRITDPREFAEALT
ncbi:MAG: aconitase/3-isopropylmalate dehydratase large subunit family protein [Acidobacteria bacterium]|nr:aconitase/3-isopropylmalate dehydratase large subunit family protein [Acidobacteriota bacterium]